MRGKGKGRRGKRRKGERKGRGKEGRGRKVKEGKGGREVSNIIIL